MTELAKIIAHSVFGDPLGQFTAKDRPGFERVPAATGRIVISFESVTGSDERDPVWRHVIKSSVSVKKR